jgi:hypothetical protein
MDNGEECIWSYKNVNTSEEKGGRIRGSTESRRTELKK